MTKVQCCNQSSVLAATDSEFVKLKQKQYPFPEVGRQTEDAVTAVLSIKTVTVCKATLYNNNFAGMRFEVLLVLMVQNVIFWVMTLCGIVQEPVASTFS
ncbi:hypothetical protein B7P43_G01563 [Cryptotermes secundus]|uniref:Uncharacterized protein n=1 Tax=Cryptotermes secundus TaxID=105785 RepID=A0A2J7PF39_9NEOP|nr:hypothetical protein B7P43_G01563 [Cryptotermes secundus]